MLRHLLRAAVPAAATAIFALPLAAQADGPCRIVPDSVAAPTPAQIAERRQLRMSLDSIARRNGVAEPSAILFVDVDSTRKGNVVFIDSNLTPQARDAALARVADYLSTLQVGRAYQALIRLDGEYVAPAPGKRSCSPVLENRGQLSDLMQAVIERHPGRRSQAESKRAVVRLVVNRRGTVSWAEVVQPTGDAFIDQYVQGIAEQLRFTPASVDGVPYDVRFRFNMTFNLN